MVHNEMSFLFGDINQSNLDVIRNNNDGNAGDVFGVINTSKYGRVYKDTSHNNNVWGYLNDVIYPTKNLNQDPYMALLEYFNGVKTPSMGLKPADFVYLKDLGVYPINRLIILRRFRDGCIVPNNLTLFKERPIATVVGWVKMDDQNKDLFSLSFNEKWVETSDTLDKVIQKIMKEQFNIKTEMFIPVPGWSQGFLFGMLNKMGLTNYDSTHIPTGDPNVLRTSVMREVEQQSVMSGFKINLETAYEQKYIRDVDPGLSFQDIISNLLRAGTSDMRFVINGNSDAFKQFVGAVNSDAAGSADKWFKFGQQMIEAFMGSISDFFQGLGNGVNGDQTSQAIYAPGSSLEKDVNDASKKETEKNKADQADKDRLSKKKQAEKDKLYNDFPKDKNGKIKSEDQAKLQLGITAIENKTEYASLKPNPTSTSQQSKELTEKKSYAGDLTKGKDIFFGIYNTVKGFMDVVLAGSVYRYRWPLRGSIGVMSGLNTTPWHLTIGNPFSPILNIGNIVVENVKLDFSNELGFNDMPKSVKATFQLKLGRDLGKQEIERMFNNQYGRIYSLAGSSNSGSTNTNTNEDSKTSTHDAVTAKDTTKSDNYGTTKSNTYTKSNSDVKAKQMGMMSNADYAKKYPIKIGG